MPCVACLILAVPPELLAQAPARGELPVALAVRVRPAAPVVLPARADVLIVEPPGGDPAEALFTTRTFITAARAQAPGLTIALDAAAFIDAGLSLDRLEPYTDAIVGRQWRRVDPAVTTGVG